MGQEAVDKAMDLIEHGRTLIAEFVVKSRAVALPPIAGTPLSRDEQDGLWVQRRSGPTLAIR